MANIGRLKTIEPSMDKYKKMIEQNSQTRKTGFVVFLLLVIMSIGVTAYMLFNKEYAAAAIIQGKEVMYEHSTAIFTEEKKRTDKYLWKVEWQGSGIHPLGSAVQVDAEIFDQYDVGDHVVITFRGNKVIDVK